MRKCSQRCGRFSRRRSRTRRLIQEWGIPALCRTWMASAAANRMNTRRCSLTAAWLAENDMDLYFRFPVARVRRRAAFGYLQHRMRIRLEERRFARISRGSFGFLKAEIQQVVLLTGPLCNKQHHHRDHRQLHLCFSRIAALSSWTISCEALIAAAC